MKKITSIVVLVAMLVCALASCKAEETNTNVNATTTRPVRDVQDNLPAGLNYNNATVTIIIDDNYETQRTLYSSALNTDVLNDAIYDRDNKVAERLGVKFKWILVQNAEGQAEDSIKSGLDEYSIVADSSIALYADGAKGYYTNLLSDRAKYIELDQPYWNSYIAEQAKIDGKVFALTGDLSLTLMKYVYATFFNKNLLSKMNKNVNLYDIVDKGEWTIDKQLEIIKNTYVDVLGDGRTHDDIYGLGFDDCGTLDTYWSAFDLTMVKRDENGTPSIDPDISKFDAVVSKLYSIMYENKDAYYIPAMQYEDSYVTETINKFAGDQFLFTTLTLQACDSKTVRDMESEYGIIPMPKWDTAQEDYYSFVGDGHTVFSIPTTVKDPVMISAVLEAMASESYRYVTPAYYNKVLKGRYMSDPESTQMLDKITANIKVDFAWIHAFNLDKLAMNTVRYYLREGKSSFATAWKGNHKRYEKFLKDLLASYAKIEG